MVKKLKKAEKDKIAEISWRAQNFLFDAKHFCKLTYRTDDINNNFFIFIKMNFHRNNKRTERISLKTEWDVFKRTVGRSSENWRSVSFRFWFGDRLCRGLGFMDHRLCLLAVGLVARHEVELRPGLVWGWEPGLGVTGTAHSRNWGQHQA